MGGGGHMNPAFLQPLQIDIPDILERHSRNAEALFMDLLDKQIPLVDSVTVTAVVAAVACGAFRPFAPFAS